ncbi:MAG TPA: hypothetical protein VF765_26295 [Polyangiaceae bacterium]
MSTPEGATVVRLDATGVDAEDFAALASQLPLASTLPPRTVVAVPAVAVRRRRFLRGVLGDRKVPVSRAARCTALLLRGYVDVHADDGSAWGFSSPC